jgi:iron complex outermembrane receptor protein
LTLEGDRLYLTLGSKWENNPYTNDEFSPSVRVLWTPNPKDSIWAAVSKAERTPPEAAGSLNIYFGGIPPTFDPNGPYYFGLVPNPQLKSETLVAYELGYRTTPTQETSLDLSLYYNHYDNLISINDIGDYNPDGLPGFPPGPGLGIDGPTTPLGGTYMQVLQLQNTGSGAVYGAELSFKWDPQDNLHFAASYTYEDFDQQLKDSLNRELGAAPPHNLANGRVSWSPLKELELNTALYFTDTTTIYDPDPNQTSQTNSYFRWDLGARWKATENLEVSAWALDLEGAHTETLLSYGILPTQVTPTLYGQLALRY